LSGDCSRLREGGEVALLDTTLKMAPGERVLAVLLLDLERPLSW
jgi:hypothetical protein